MQMAPRDDLEAQFADLTDRQKAIVEAWAEHPEATNCNIADTHAPRIYNEEYADSDDDHIKEMNESYVSQFSNKDGINELIKYKQDIVQNQRFEGNATTEGDPFSADPNMQTQREAGYQTWDERPNNQAAQRSEPQQTRQQAEQQTDTAHDHIPVDSQQIELRAPVAAQIHEDRVTVHFDKQYFQSLLEGQALPPELHRQLIEDVLSVQLA